MGTHDTGTAGKTLEETAATRPSREPLAIPHLFLLLESERPWAGGSRHDLMQIGQVLIGRGAKRSVERSHAGGTPTLELRVPDARMSHTHARITCSGGHLSLEDLGSTNGSRVRGEPVLSPVTLRDRDVLEIGRTFFRVRTELATSIGTPPDVDSTQFGEAARGLATLSPVLADQNTALQKVAASALPVLIQGETGTGKELVARAIHSQSGRTGPLVVVNCGAIPSTLVEAQLFGHTRGAFSGATRDEPGFVRSAHRGTLFLDEVGDLPPQAQVALLRVLQEGEVVPVGRSLPERVDVRVLGATHQDLQRSVSRGSFRPDLYARLAGFVYRLPPLRERVDDIGLLVAAILSRIAADRPRALTFTPQAVRWLLERDWPLNIRQLELILSIATVLAGEGAIDVAHLTARELGGALPETQTSEDRDELLRARLLEEMRRAKGNIAEVARKMGKARMQVQRWMKRFQIDPKGFRTP